MKNTTLIIGLAISFGVFGNNSNNRYTEKKSIAQVIKFIQENSFRTVSCNYYRSFFLP
jgi:hypothetical protein